MDKALKQRLVGASVLVLLAVVVLPMLLSGKPDNQQESRTIELPPKPGELEFEKRRFPIGQQDGTAPTTMEPMQSQPDEISGQQGAGTETVQDRPRPATVIVGDVQKEPGPEIQTQASAPLTQQPRQKPRSQPAQQPEQSTATGRYLVQVASFSSTGNANRLAGRLREKGMPVVTDTVESAAGTLQRVRVGPFDEKTDADSVINELKSQYPDLSPRVVDLRPGQTAPVTATSDPLVRWVVQVGSFSEKANADKLVFRLRDAGYRASGSAVSSGGSTVYKVRVGPVIDRSEAVTLAESIKDGLGLDGLVMSTD